MGLNCVNSCGLAIFKMSTRTVLLISALIKPPLRKHSPAAVSFTPGQCFRKKPAVKPSPLLSLSPVPRMDGQYVISSYPLLSLEHVDRSDQAQDLHGLKIVPDSMRVYCRAFGYCWRPRFSDSIQNLVLGVDIRHSWRGS